MAIKTTISHLETHKKYVKILRFIDDFLASQEYSKLELPSMTPALIPESYLNIFRTEFQYEQKREKLYLIPSSELYLKRLLAEGCGSCYTLMKNFRNSEPHTSRHLPEFMMLEMYKVDATYFDIAEDTMALLRYLADKLYASDSITWQGNTISLNEYEKITVAEAFEKYAGITDIFNEQEFLKQAAGKGYVTDGFSYTDVWSQIYTQDVEPHLGMNGMPTVIYDYPKELAAVVEYNPEKKVASRLEIYINGIELGNCGTEVSEKTDFSELEERLTNEATKVDYTPDTEFKAILKKLPHTAGIAIGVDRLAMILLDVESVQDLQLITY
jgi:elongation factor P--beta-lysine ligase